MVRNFHQVDEGVYRSGLLEEGTVSGLLDYNIKTIISFKTNPIVSAWERGWAEANGINHIHLPMLLIPRIDERKVLHAYKEILNNRKPVLVHCTRGADRTGVVVATYRILKNHWTYEKAKKEMYELGFNPMYRAWEGFLQELSCHGHNFGTKNK